MSLAWFLLVYRDRTHHFDACPKKSAKRRNVLSNRIKHAKITTPSGSVHSAWYPRCLLRRRWSLSLFTTSSGDSRVPVPVHYKTKSNGVFFIILFIFFHFCKRYSGTKRFVCQRKSKFCQRFSFIFGLTYLSGWKVTTSSSTWLGQTAFISVHLEQSNLLIIDI